MVRILFSLAVVCALISCGEIDKLKDEPDQKKENKKTADAGPKDELAVLSQEIAQLSDKQNVLANFIESDFNCLAADVNANLLIRRLCKILNDSALDTKTEIELMLKSYADQMGAELTLIQSDVAYIKEQLSTQGASIDAIQAQLRELSALLTQLRTSLFDLTLRMTSVESALSALQSAIHALSNKLGSSLEAIKIGQENLNAGPVYESVLRRIDKSSLTAFASNWGPPLLLASLNPIGVSKGSDLAHFSSGGENLQPGDVVNLSKCEAGASFSATDLAGDFSVVSVKTVGKDTEFNLRLKVVKQSPGNASIGGKTCEAKKLLGRGLTEIWNASMGTDKEVRSTTVSSLKYNYIVHKIGQDFFICYSHKEAEANFVTLSTLGTNVVCK